MIENISLKFGRIQGAQPESFKPTSITVFVGPNNSGKSKVLREIHNYCSQGKQDVGDVIIQNIEFQPFTQESAEARIIRQSLRPRPAENLSPKELIVGKNRTRHRIDRTILLRALLEPNNYPNHFCPFYLSYNTLMLDGRGRSDLINQQPAGDLKEEPQSSLQALFSDNKRREEVRRMIYDALNLYFVIDPTSLGHLRIRLSRKPPRTELVERGIHDEAVAFHMAAQPIEQASDGVKAFVGMITEISAGDPHVLLIDEPEAFLHPALSYKLGKEIALASKATDKRIFVSTHSPSFVMGCIQSGAEINIIRLTYQNDVPTARLLPNHKILRLMRNPLLRSTGVLTGLFYEYVVVTESDADRAFYQEINERLLRENLNRGIPNCLFLNAQNKQTVKTIVQPLREMGIPTAGIVDVDVFKDGGSVWKSFLSAGYIPNLEQESLEGLRAKIRQKLEASEKNMKRDGGLDLLEDSDREAANNLLDRLEQYGLFVVRKGELESWLKELGATGHGPSWLINVFERMGEDPQSPKYVHPHAGDVWQFLTSLNIWFGNSSRRGIPS